MAWNTRSVCSNPAEWLLKFLREDIIKLYGIFYLMFEWRLHHAAVSLWDMIFRNTTAVGRFLCWLSLKSHVCNGHLIKFYINTEVNSVSLKGNDLLKLSHSMPCGIWLFKDFVRFLSTHLRKHPRDSLYIFREQGNLLHLYVVLHNLCYIAHKMSPISQLLFFLNDTFFTNRALECYYPQQ